MTRGVRACRLGQRPPLQRGTPEPGGHPGETARERGLAVADCGLAQQARNKLAVTARTHDPQLIEEARRNLEVAKLEQHIRDVVAAAGPLTPEDADRLRSLLPAPAGS